MGNGLNEPGEDFLGTDVTQQHIRPKKKRLIYDLRYDLPITIY